MIQFKVLGWAVMTILAGIEESVHPVIEIDVTVIRGKLHPIGPSRKEGQERNTERYGPNHGAAPQPHLNMERLMLKTYIVI